MTKRRIAEIRKLARNSSSRLLIEELCIEVEKLSTPTDFRLDDETRPRRQARGTLQEFIAYATGIGLPASDAEFFFHKLESQDWNIGGKPIKDWRAAIRSWKAAGYLPSQKNGTRQTVSNNGPVRNAL